MFVFVTRVSKKKTVNQSSAVLCFVFSHCEHFSNYVVFWNEEKEKDRDKSVRVCTFFSGLYSTDRIEFLEFRALIFLVHDGINDWINWYLLDHLLGNRLIFLLLILVSFIHYAGHLGGAQDGQFPSLCSIWQLLLDINVHSSRPCRFLLKKYQSENFFLISLSLSISMYKNSLTFFFFAFSTQSESESKRKFRVREIKGKDIPSAAFCIFFSLSFSLCLY